MSTSVLPQLIAVDSKLSEQVIALTAQLNELQEKRKGIQTVIAMFESGATSEAADSTAVAEMTSPTQTTKTAAKRKTAKATIKAADTSEAMSEAPAEETPAEEVSAKTVKTKATRGRPTKTKETKSAVEGKQVSAKRSGRTANWQRYVQESYRKAPLPDVIVGVLQAHPTNVFKIADVMNVVFKEDMPKSHFLKARNRISNILSAGARDGVWYRGRGGTYSMSEKAIKAS